MYKKGLLSEKRKHPRNEAERKYRLVTRSKRLTKRAAKLKPFTGKDGQIDYGFGHGVTLNKQFTIAHRERQRKGSKKGREERLQWLKARGGEENNYQTPNYVSKVHIRKQKAKVVANKEKRDFSQSMGSEENGFEKLRKEGLYEKRRHPRNEAERVLRQQNRHQRGVRRAEQLRGLEVAGGTNAPKGHTRKAGNALQRLNQKQDSKAGKENTRVRHVKNHIMMGIRDEDGQLTPKASKTYVSNTKSRLQRKREKRQFNQAMGKKEDGFKKLRQGKLEDV